MPGFGSGSREPGAGISSRQRLAVLVSAVTIAAAMLIVLALSPREPPARPPRDLLGYAEPEALAAFRLRRVAGLWHDFAQSRFYAEARALGLPDLWTEVERRVLPYVPPALRDFAPLARKLLEMDVAAFVYAAGTRLEFAAVARANVPVTLEIPTDRSEEYRGHTLRALAPVPGREVHLSWRGPFLLAASSRERLKTLVDRHLGVGGARLEETPAFRRLTQGLPPGDRVFAFVDLGRAFAVPPWSELASAVSPVLLGEPHALAISADPRPGGVRVAAALTHGSLPAWAVEATSILGPARPLRAPSLAPEGALAFGGLQLSPSQLGARLHAKGGPVPAWIAPVRRLLSRALEDGELGRAIENFGGEAAGGLVPASPLPSFFAVAEVRDPKAAERTLQALSDSVPGTLGEVMRLLTRRRAELIGSVRLVVRDLPLGVGGVGYGLHGNWLFGGGRLAAEGVAKALGGAPWKPSALAREVFSQPAHALAWIDARAALAAVHRTVAGLGPGRDLLGRLGRLPDALVDAGFTARAESGRVLAQAFVRYRDL